MNAHAFWWKRCSLLGGGNEVQTDKARAQLLDRHRGEIVRCIILGGSQSSTLECSHLMVFFLRSLLLSEVIIIKLLNSDPLLITGQKGGESICEDFTIFQP